MVILTVIGMVQERQVHSSNNQDYQAYVAYYQGYNYDKNTGAVTPMNQQQLNDMRQQMNQNGGANFGQGGQR